jgi:DNA-binding NarL/FixJ family response regulator
MRPRAASWKTRHFDPAALGATVEVHAGERDNGQVHVLSGVELVGREGEIDAGGRFLAAIQDGATALLIRGEAGIGKTVLWRHIADEARGLGSCVLVSRCVQTEMPLSFATLADLLEDVFDDIANELPPAQRSALEFALRRTEPGSDAPDALTVSRAVLGALRLRAASTPVVLAIDDVQWIDPASARVLSFAFRRLEGERVAVLVTRRGSGDAKEQRSLTAALAEGRRVERIDLGPLSIEALDRLVRTRLAVSLPHATLVHLHEASGGNPLFALEFARKLSDSMPATTPPMPASLRELVRDRLAAFPAPLRPLLELVATLGQPPLELLERAYKAPLKKPLDAAVSAGALNVEDDGRVRFTHPLLASAVYTDAGSARRRALHRAAAGVATNIEERARHLALASAGPDEQTAALLERAAEHAHGRGAPDAAAELAEWAQRRTPPEHEVERHRRVVLAATYLIESDDERGARRLLDPLLVGDVPEAVRAASLLAQARAEWNDRPALLESLRQALEYARGEPRLRCEALILYAWHGGHLSGDDFLAERMAHEALALADQVQDRDLREQAAVLAVEIATFRAQPFAELPPEPLESPPPRIGRPPWGMTSRRAVQGRALMFRGRLREARAVLNEELERASQQGSEIRLATLHQNLSELELRAGNWDLARGYAEDGLAIMREASGNGEMILLLARGRVEAHQGRIDGALADLGAALARAESQLDVLNTIRARASLGFLYLSLSDHPRAWGLLEGLSELVERMGADEPAATGAPLPNVVETLVALGRLDDAERIVRRLEQTAWALEHAWAIPAAQRCRGLLLLGRGELEEAIDALSSSQAGFELIGFPFDRARSLLALGSALRRAGRRKLAAEKLDEARSLFEQLGAALWLERAANELRRAAPRPRRDHELTVAETRVAELVATGATNKEVAAQLFTTVATVEAHLTRVYRKIGLRSRSELARRVADGTLILPRL